MLASSPTRFEDDVLENFAAHAAPVAAKPVTVGLA
jgi:hypothetical protein